MILRICETLCRRPIKDEPSEVKWECVKDLLSVVLGSSILVGIEKELGCDTDQEIIIVYCNVAVLDFVLHWTDLQPSAGVSRSLWC